VQVRVEGPLVTALQNAFEEHWIKTFDETLELARINSPLSHLLVISVASLIASHSFSVAPLPLTQAIAFAAAERRIWITNAYSAPSSGQVDLLVKAVQRHVDVRLIVPGPHNDQPLTKSAGRTAYGHMLQGAGPNLRISTDDDSHQGHGDRRDVFGRWVVKSRSALVAD
jgi:cardiolipin synthase